MATWDTRRWAPTLENLVKDTLSVSEGSLTCYTSLWHVTNSFWITLSRKLYPTREISPILCRVQTCLWKEAKMFAIDHHDRIYCGVSCVGTYLNVSLPPTVVRVPMRKKIPTQRQRERKNVGKPTTHGRGESSYTQTLPPIWKLIKICPERYFVIFKLIYNPIGSESCRV